MRQSRGTFSWSVLIEQAPVAENFCQQDIIKTAYWDRLLVLWGHHPPVYLKADKKGRHRYAQALRRANRGDMKPLGCLIAMALVEIYGKLIDAVGERRTS
jgi:hypothetical protein